MRFSRHGNFLISFVCCIMTLNLYVLLLSEYEILLVIGVQTFELAISQVCFYLQIQQY